MGLVSIEVRDRARGALVGLAVGDALGTTLEFGPRRERSDYHTEITGGGPFRLDPGVFTDDTSMALALADSLLHNGGVLNRADLLRRFANWYQRGEYSPTGRCFDIGNQTVRGIRGYLERGRTVASEDPGAQGNGGIMRLAPVAICARSDLDAVALAEQQSVTTHASLTCVDYAGRLAELLWRLIDGTDLPTSEEVVRIRDRDRSEVRAGGHVLQCYEAALWAVLSTGSFEAAVVEAVNLGDDADTTGAVAGQIAGALYGYSAIPERWLGKLVWHHRIFETADSLVALRG